MPSSIIPTCHQTFTTAMSSDQARFVLSLPVCLCVCVCLCMPACACMCLHVPACACVCLCMSVCLCVSPFRSLCLFFTCLQLPLLPHLSLLSRSPPPPSLFSLSTSSLSLSFVFAIVKAAVSLGEPRAMWWKSNKVQRISRLLNESDRSSSASLSKKATAVAATEKSRK